MSTPTVTLTGSITASGEAHIRVTLREPYSDAVNGVLWNPEFTEGGSDFSFDIPDPTSDGSGLFWQAVIKVDGVTIYNELVQIGTTNGDSQTLFELTPAESFPVSTYMLQPSGTPTAGEFPIATGDGQASAWSFLAGLQPTGVTETDTANVQALLNLGVQIVPLASGSFSLSELTPPANTICGLQGAGSQSTFLTWDTSDYGISFGGNTDAQRFVLTGLALTQNGAGDLLTCVGESTSRFPQLVCTDVSFTLGSSNTGGALLNGDGPTDSNILASSFFLNCTFNTESTTRTVPGINLVCNVGGGMSNCTWDKCYFNPSDNDEYCVFLSATSSGSDDEGAHTGMCFRDCRFESPCGGAIKSMSGRGLIIENITIWDLAVTDGLATENSIIYIGTNTNQYASEGTQIRGYYRYQGSAGNGPNASGPWDIYIDSVSAQTVIESVYATQGGYHTTPAPIYLNFNSCPSATLINQQSPGAVDATTTSIVNPPVQFTCNDAQAAPTQNIWYPSDYGWVATSTDPGLLNFATTRNFTAGVHNLIGLRIHNWVTIQGLVDYYIATAGVGSSLTTGENFFALLNSSGTLIAQSGDCSGETYTVSTTQGSAEVTGTGFSSAMIGTSYTIAGVTGTFVVASYQSSTEITMASTIPTGVSSETMTPIAANNWTTSGNKEGAILNLVSGQSFTLAPGLYWVDVIPNGTTPPGFAYNGAAQQNITSQYINSVLASAAKAKYATNGSGVTSPGNITPSSNSLSQLVPWFVGIR